MEVCDRVTVIRRGKMIGDINIEDASPQILASMMVGRDVVLEVEKEPGQPEEVVLEVENIHAVGLNGLPVLNGVSFQVRAGEIVGIAGVAGNGQSELIEVITGLHKAKSGAVRLNNEAITNKSANYKKISGPNICRRAPWSCVPCLIYQTDGIRRPNF